ncbi:hypothetical protein M885DRAFT_321749 [Pelagophyceae sp. CCMP2097]|nr:hypothetical protein M885DRAFT_321749 [Pelagophyceae sp. CCMP2097]
MVSGQFHGAPSATSGPCRGSFERSGAVQRGRRRGAAQDALLPDLAPRGASCGKTRGERPRREPVLMILRRPSQKGPPLSNRPDSDPFFSRAEDNFDQLGFDAPVQQNVAKRCQKMGPAAVGTFFGTFFGNGLRDDVQKRAADCPSDRASECASRTCFRNVLRERASERPSDRARKRSSEYSSNTFFGNVLRKRSSETSFRNVLRKRPSETWDSGGPLCGAGGDGRSSKASGPTRLKAAL